MDYITVVIDSFWIIMERMAVIFTPILAIWLVFRLLRSILR